MIHIAILSCIYLLILFIKWDWFIQQTELSQIGFNVLTLSLVATTALAIFSAWALFHQEKRIRKTKSSKAISKIWYIWGMFLFLGGIVYGFISLSFNLIFTGTLLFYWYARVIAAIWKYGGFSKAQFAIGSISLIGVLSIIIFPESGAMIFGGFMFISVFPRADVALEIWRARSSGAVEIKVIIIGIINTGFWLTYGIITKNPPLIIMNPIFMVIFILTLILWVRYREKPKNTL